MEKQRDFEMQLFRELEKFFGIRLNHNHKKGWYFEIEK